MCKRLCVFAFGMSFYVFMYLSVSLCVFHSNVRHEEEISS